MPVILPLLLAGLAAASYLLLVRGAGGGVVPGSAPATPAPDAASVAACRAAVPVEPGLKPTSVMRGGHVYGGSDPALLAWLKPYLAARAARASGEARRALLAFAALQGREGSTAAINTYDSQVVTWGTGWGGLGALPLVMDRLVAASPAVVARLAACGVRYLGQGRWAVDDGTGRIVEGRGEALEVIRRTPALLNLLIAIAKDPATREAVADAQAGVFVATSGKIAGSETIATQALYTLASHLKHWAPGYMLHAVERAAAAVPGAPSEERDRRLAPAIVQAFYAAAPADSYIVKGWPQAQRYMLRDMKEDGLDLSGDPVLAAASAPTKEAAA